jgi:molybdopterin-guanine dinucleotide biosynthesis protein
MKSSIKFDTKDFMKVLDNIDRQLDTVIIESLKEMGQELLKMSNKIVPVDTGALKKSGKIEVVGAEVTVGYYEEYAAIIHEKLSLHLKNGQSKYLEDPLKTNLSLWQRIFAKNIEKIL